ncbi:MAG: peptide deformylase [Acidiferrobacter sp.]
MALREILRYPDPRLRKKALPVARVDKEIQDLVRDMAETMYKAPGIGLAATQIDVAKRVIVIDASADHKDLKVFVNPVISERSGVFGVEEGCLSVPGVFEEVERAQRVTVRALDQHGTPFELVAEDLLAVCIQHEIDHLDGKVFVDYLSRLKQQRIRKKLEKQQRLAM